MTGNGVNAAELDAEDMLVEGSLTVVESPVVEVSPSSSDVHAASALASVAAPPIRNPRRFSDRTDQRRLRSGATWTA